MTDTFTVVGDLPADATVTVAMRMGSIVENGAADSGHGIVEARLATDGSLGGGGNSYFFRYPNCAIAGGEPCSTAQGWIGYELVRTVTVNDANRSFRVDASLSANGGGNPGEDAEHRRQAHRHQGELHGRPGVLDQDARDRPVLLEGLAEIAVERSAEEPREPDEERVVQAELLPQDRDVPGGGAEVRHEHRGRVARQRVHEGEDGGRDPQEDEEGRGQSPGEEAGHGRSGGTRARAPASQAAHPAHVARWASAPARSVEVASSSSTEESTVRQSVQSTLWQSSQGAREFPGTWTS